MKNKLRILMALFIVALLCPIFISQTVSAASVKIGDTQILSGGYLSTCIAISGGKPVWKVDLSVPTYTQSGQLMNPTWILNNDGTYSSGANNFTSTVDGSSVGISANGNSAGWSPEISIATSVQIGRINNNNRSVQQMNNDSSTLLATDPINSNYHNNTLQWDLGNGIYRNLRVIQGMEEEYYIITQPLTSDLTVDMNLVSNGLIQNPVSAWDANGKNVPVSVDNSGNITLLQSDTDGFTLPITIDPSTTFTSSAADGQLDDTNASWATVQSDTTAQNVSTYSSIAVLDWLTGGMQYIIARDYLYFDTSSLVGDTVTSATLNLYTTSVSSIDAESVGIQIGSPTTYPHNPLVVGDYNKAYYTGDGGSISMSSIVSGYNPIPLNSIGLSWINTTGYTKFCIRTSNDINNVTPTGLNIWGFNTYTAGVGKDPQLIVTYTAGAPPATPTISMTTSDITGINANLATFNCNLTSLGSYTTNGVNVSFVYGLNTNVQNTPPVSGNTVSPTQTMTTTGNIPVPYQATGLISGQVYHVMAYAYYNSTQFVTSVDVTFTAGAGVNSRTITIVSGNVFEGYQETGDWLIVAEVVNNYPQSGDFRELWDIELLGVDDTTVLAIAPLANEGDRPCSIYLSAVQASSLQYGVAYHLQVVGNFAGAPTAVNNPTMDITLTPEDWRGSDLTKLDNWVTQTVGKHMETTDGYVAGTYVASSTGIGLVITDNAGGYFTDGIPQIMVVRPNLFQVSTSQVPAKYGTANNQYDANHVWATQVGSEIASDWTSFGTLFGTTGQHTMGYAIGLLIVIMTIFGIGMGGKGLPLLVLTFPLIMLGNYFGALGIQMLIVPCIAMVVLFARQFWVKPT